MCYAYSMNNQETTFPTFTTFYNISGKMMIRNNQTDNVWQSLIEDKEFRNAIESLYDFVVETESDADDAYDWVCDQANVSSFVADEPAWNMFYSVWEQAYA